MNLGIMSNKQKKMAENECVLLKLLVGPSLIRYYDHFKEDTYLYILMEYAEGGSLREKFNEHSLIGVPIDHQQILRIHK